MRTIKAGLAALTLLVCSCKKESSIKTSPSLAQTNTELSLFIGKHYGGGIIFYLDSTGQHGLISDSVDLGKFTWWNGSFITTGAIETAIYTGESNTRRIISIQGTTGNYAALVCANLTKGGHSDWFLPSKDELFELYKQENVVGGFHKYYLSSTEKSTNYAWYQCFHTGHQGGTNKSHLYYVRAIRAF